MEKASLLTCFATAALFSLHFLAATAATNDANAPASLTSALPSDNASAEMVHKRHTTAYYFNQVSWFDCNAEIFEDTSTGDSWIKIFHNGYKKGQVVSNPDYNPPQRQLDIRSRKKIIVCEYCGRIMIDPELAGIAPEVKEEPVKEKTTRSRKKAADAE